LQEFYKKGDRRDSSCKVCIAQTKRECYKKKQKIASRRRRTLLDFEVSFVRSPNLALLSQVLKGYFDDG